MTPNEWASWMEGYSLRLDDQWRQTRILYALHYNLNVDSHNRQKPEELIPLASDTKPEPIKIVSLDERLNVATKHREAIAKGKHVKVTLQEINKLNNG